MITGERVRLRAIERGDLASFVAWLNDPEVIAGLEIYRPLGMTEEERWFEEQLKGPADELPLAIEVKEEESWKLVGNLRLFRIDWRIRQAEVGIFIGDKGYWNKGYGTEAMRLILNHAFNTLNLNRIYLRVYENNERAYRAYEKVGFRLEGRERQAIFQNGRYLDVLRMSILREEWLQQNQEKWKHA